MEEKAIDLFSQDEKQVAISKEDELLKTVLASGNIEVLERFIALRKSEEERQARLAFEAEFAKLRAELTPIIKTKINGAFKSKYAELCDLQQACDAKIFNHGFFYTWREEALEKGKRIIMDISGYGHTKTNFFDCAQIEGNSAQNALQVGGAMSSYGQRYTFKAGFGIVIAGEDTDGNTLDGGSIEIDLRDYIKSGKLLPDAVKIIEKELNKPEADRNIETLHNYWKRAKAKCEK